MSRWHGQVNAELAAGVARIEAQHGPALAEDLCAARAEIDAALALLDDPQV